MTALLALSLCVSGPAAARDIVAQAAPDVRTAPRQEQRFDIPAGDLQAALLAFSRQVDLQLLYPAELTVGLRTEALQGSFTTEAALRRLLSGTGLAYRYTTANTIALSRPPAGDGAGTLTLGPITVTGERAVRSLRETASSVAVFDSEDIDAKPGVGSTNELLSRIPNLTATGTGNLAPAVRGVDGTGPAQGADAFFAGTRPRLNMQVDGRPVSYNELIFGNVSLWDVERVEMLRGAKSTLQGRNSIAGTVVVKTKDPTYDFETGGRVIGGSQDFRQASAFVSGPIVDDQLAFRIAVDRETRDSFVHFQPYNDIDPSEFRTVTMRGKLLIEPKAFDEFSAMVSLNHSDHSGPQTEWVAQPFDDHVSSSPQQPVFNPKATSGTLDATWEFSNDLALEGTMSVSDLHIKRHAATGAGNVEIDGLEFVGEPRLRFSGMDGRLSGLGGFYAFHGRQDEFIDFPSDGTFDDRTTTVAAFGEATYTLVADVDLTVGGRVEQEERRRTGGAGIFAIDLDKTYSAFLPKLDVAWRATDVLTVGAGVSRGYNGGGAGFTFNPPFESYTYDPEYVWTYETYARADLLDGKLSVHGNLFFSEYTDMQLPFDLNPDPTVWSVVIRNADRAVTYGAEVGGRWLAAPGLELSGEVGLLHTEVTEYPGSGIEGHDLANAPAFTSNIGVSYRHSSGFDFDADARFSDAYYSTIENAPRGKTRPYFLVNTQVGYRLFGDRSDARVFAFVRNVFDWAEPISIETGATSATDTATLPQPRTFGIGLEMTF